MHTLRISKIRVMISFIWSKVWLHVALTISMSTDHWLIEARIAMTLNWCLNRINYLCFKVHALIIVVLRWLWVMWMIQVDHDICHTLSTLANRCEIWLKSIVLLLSDDIICCPSQVFNIKYPTGVWFIF